MAPAQIDPNVAFECSSQSPLSGVLRRPFESALYCSIDYQAELRSHSPVPQSRLPRMQIGALGHIAI
jgi:hypothetical protein